MTSLLGTRRRAIVSFIHSWSGGDGLCCRVTPSDGHGPAKSSRHPHGPLHQASLAGAEDPVVGLICEDWRWARCWSSLSASMERRPSSFLRMLYQNGAPRLSKRIEIIMPGYLRGSESCSGHCLFVGRVMSPAVFRKL